METISKLTAPGVTLLITLATGFWLSRLDKPLNPLLFNVHKLLAVAVIILVVIQAMNGIPFTGSRSLLLLIGIGCALCVLALFATGGLMSAAVGNYELWHNIHRVATILLVGLVTYTGFLILR